MDVANTFESHRRLEVSRGGKSFSLSLQWPSSSEKVEKDWTDRLGRDRGGRNVVGEDVQARAAPMQISTSKKLIKHNFIFIFPNLH